MHIAWTNEAPSEPGAYRPKFPGVRQSIAATTQAAPVFSFPLQYNRSVGKLVASCPERGFHVSADPFPGCAACKAMHAAVGDDLDFVVGQQQVNQHAVVVFGIPHP